MCHNVLVYLCNLLQYETECTPTVTMFRTVITMAVDYLVEKVCISASVSAGRHFQTNYSLYM